MASSITWGPTFEEMLNPETIRADIRNRVLATKDADPLDAINLYNITWKGPDGTPYYRVLPKELTGVDANIIVLYSRDFPTGSHKVGATYSVTMERQLEGHISPNASTIVFPSTGNYGIGGAWVGPRMGYDTVAVLPELMSQERFEMIAFYGARCFRTKGGESSVKEIYDKCRELRHDPKVRVLNQFQEFANYRFHNYVTGNTVVGLVKSLETLGVGNGRCSAFVSAMGSGGTIAAGDRLKHVFPDAKIVGLEPIQCPTLYCNGYGDHDIQGIGDKHVTWIHNVKNMDALMCLDDIECKMGLQLLTDPIGMDYLVRSVGIRPSVVEDLSTMFGISGVCNVLGSIKTAKYYGMTSGDNVVTILTDGIDRYVSVMQGMVERFGRLDTLQASRRYSIFQNVKTDYVQEGTVQNRDRWFNLKYYTWVEQQGKTVAQLNNQKSQACWQAAQAKVADVDAALRKARSA